MAERGRPEGRADGQTLALVASHAPSLSLFRSDLIRAACARGHTVLCLAPDFDHGTAADLMRLGARTLTFPLDRTGLNPVADLQSYRTLVRIFKSARPDVVCGYTPKPAIYASLAAHQASVGRIVPMITGLGYAFNSANSLKAQLVRRAALALYARALKRSHGVIFHNADDRAVLVKAGSLDRRLPATVVGGSGVDLDRFPTMPFPPADDGLVFLMIARLVKYKGVIEFCEAARAVRASGARARFVLAGPPEDGPSAVSVATVKAYSDAVDYVGPQQSVQTLLGQCHVYVLPSHGEGLPRTVLEAMAVGRPIITTTARGCRDTVEDGVNGITVPVGDPAALAKAIGRLLGHTDKLAAMAAASRRMAAARFDVRIVTRDMLIALGLAPA